MISIGTQKLLKQYLIELAKLEKSLEMIREKLCDIHGFEPYSVFKYLSDGNATIKLEQLQNNNRRGIKVQGLIAVILNNDTTFQGQLSYNDFLRMVLVNDNLNLRQSVAIREKEMIVTEEMVDTVFELIEREGMGYLSLKKYKDQLQKRYDFDTYDCFRFLDSKKDNYLDSQEIAQVLGKNNTHLIVFLSRVLTNHLNVSKIPFENFRNVLNDRDNYVVQFQEEKLQRKQQQNVQAYHCTLFPKAHKTPFNPYDKPDRSLRLGNSTLRTPERISSSFVAKTPERVSTQSRFSRLQILRTPPSDMKALKTLEDHQKQWTPVRKIHKNSIHQKLEGFHKKAATASKVPMRHSPINQIQSRQFFDANQTQRFSHSKTTASSKNMSQIMERVKFSRKMI